LNIGRPSPGTGNLDLQTGKLIMELMRELNQGRGVTIFRATRPQMLSVSDLLWLANGRIERIQKREELKIEVGTIEAK
jgi:putative ABC transport system ATP-binding protein